MDRTPPPPELAQDDNCWPCRLTGSLAFAGVAAYANHIARDEALKAASASLKSSSQSSTTRPIIPPMIARHLELVDRASPTAPSTRAPVNFARMLSERLLRGMLIGWKYGPRYLRYVQMAFGAASVLRLSIPTGRNADESSRARA